MNHSIQSHPENVSGLAHKFCQFCSDNNVLTEFTSKLELALVECVNNIIEHAYQDQHTHLIDAQFTITPAKIVITLVDQGVPTPGDILNAKVQIPNAHSLPEGGWGLALIKTLTDQFQVSYEEGSNITVLTKYLK